jgi:ABC-type multidrug transport system permease subunit
MGIRWLDGRGLHTNRSIVQISLRVAFHVASGLNDHSNWGSVLYIHVVYAMLKRSMCIMIQQGRLPLAFKVRAPKSSDYVMPSFFFLSSWTVILPLFLICNTLFAFCCLFLCVSSLLLYLKILQGLQKKAFSQEVWLLACSWNVAFVHLTSPVSKPCCYVGT